ncbi:hypothetical protein D3C78_634640 [compost metagenome]
MLIDEADQQTSLALSLVARLVVIIVSSTRIGPLVLFSRGLDGEQLPGVFQLSQVRRRPAPAHRIGSIITVAPFTTRSEGGAIIIEARALLEHLRIDYPH